MVWIESEGAHNYKALEIESLLPLLVPVERLASGARDNHRRRMPFRPDFPEIDELDDHDLKMIDVTGLALSRRHAAEYGGRATPACELQVCRSGQGRRAGVESGSEIAYFEDS